MAPTGRSGDVAKESDGVSSLSESAPQSNNPHGERLLSHKIDLEHPRRHADQHSDGLVAGSHVPERSFSSSSLSHSVEMTSPSLHEKARALSQRLLSLDSKIARLRGSLSSEQQSSTLPPRSGQWLNGSVPFNEQLGQGLTGGVQSALTSLVNGAEDLRTALDALQATEVELGIVELEIELLLMGQVKGLPAKNDAAQNIQDRLPSNTSTEGQDVSTDHSSISTLEAEVRQVLRPLDEDFEICAFPSSEKPESSRARPFRTKQSLEHPSSSLSFEVAKDNLSQECEISEPELKLTSECSSLYEEKEVLPADSPLREGDPTNSRIKIESTDIDNGCASEDTELLASVQQRQPVRRVTSLETLPVHIRKKLGIDEPAQVPSSPLTPPYDIQHPPINRRRHQTMPQVSMTRLGLLGPEGRDLYVLDMARPKRARSKWISKTMSMLSLRSRGLKDDLH